MLKQLKQGIFYKGVYMLGT